MTVRTYVLGHPRPARSRGGDCYAHDLRPDPITGDPHPITERPHIHGTGHTFRQPEHCAFQNGLLRIAVVSVLPPTLSIQVVRGRMIVDDYYVDTYSDLYAGSVSEREWVDAGSVVIDAPATSAQITGVRLVEVCPEKVTVKLLVPVVSDVFLTLHRGWRTLRIQHGNPNLAVPAPVSVVRRVRLIDSPSPVGLASTGRVEEPSPVIANMYRFVAATVPVTADASQFSLTTAAVTTADFGVGVGTSVSGDRPVNLHQQLGDSSRPLHLVTEAP